ncbi:MAG: hypothetical protein IIA00_03530 [Proteobacteria bacterium]|nr:hypothetical protein [Pseudomonadota bacterium]
MKINGAGSTSQYSLPRQTVQPLRREPLSPCRDGGVPANFIPADCPVLARHWFGIGLGNDGARNLRLRRAAEHLHTLGPRPVLEALIEVADGHDLDRVLADFARLDPEVVSALGGDRMPPTPIHGVGR